mmetsp:Transcript_15261/g.14820  ORF Transcript_15261/g.14820 Transcript_15261/m.14820 type:complete len:161 (-) Transcript_15261:310-792(-)
MIKEAASIADRRFSNYLLFQIFFEILGTNGTAQVFEQNSVEFLESYIDSFNSELENFIGVHSNNTYIHDDSFNVFFNELIYQNLCEAIGYSFSEEELDKCDEYLGGILQKGLFSANLAFWDNIREMMDTYSQSDKSQEVLTELINSERLVQNEKLNLIYF